jgi:hypothetical protein
MSISQSEKYNISLTYLELYRIRGGKQTFQKFGPLFFLSVYFTKQVILLNENDFTHNIQRVDNIKDNYT